MLRELISRQPGKAELQEYEDGFLPEGHVRIKTEYSSPKHGTELHMFRGIDPHRNNRFDDELNLFVPKPEGQTENYFMKLGNMYVGRIMETGENVEGYSIGEMVAGFGPIRETHNVETSNLLKMNKNMSWQEAVCFEPAQFAFTGIRDGNVRIGDAAAVFGLGSIGLLACQFAKMAGASLIAAIDPIEKRRQAALKNGADLALDPMKQDIGMELKLATGKRGVDVSIETSGYYPALQEAFRGTAYGGNISVVGWYKECHGGFHLGREAHFNYAKLIFSRACSEPNPDFPRWSFSRISDVCWNMLSNGMIKCSNIIDPIVSFEDVVDAYMDIDMHPEKSIKLGVCFGPAE